MRQVLLSIPNLKGEIQVGVLLIFIKIRFSNKLRCFYFFERTLRVKRVLVLLGLKI